MNGMVEVEGVTEEVKSKKQGTQGNSSFSLAYMYRYRLQIEIVTCIVCFDIIMDCSCDAEKGIPDFWLTVMNANAMLAEEVMEYVSFNSYGFQSKTLSWFFINRGIFNLVHHIHISFFFNLVPQSLKYCPFISSLSRT